MIMKSPFLKKREIGMYFGKGNWMKDDMKDVFLSGWLVGCRLKADCPLMGPGPVEGVPSVGVFQRDPSPYLREFRRKPRKTPNG